MKTYKLTSSRSSAALYLAWEFGISRAREMLASLPKDTTYPTFIRLDAINMLRPISKRRWTKADLENFANRVRGAVAFQQGRLGRPLTGGDIYVKASA